MLTPKQKDILDFISRHKERFGYAPSQQEIAKSFGFKSLGTVQNYLVRLERQGLLQKTWNARRGMSVIAPQPKANAAALPLLGRVAAGYPIEAIQTNELIDVPESMLRGGENFVLKVNGHSMVDEGIFDNDYVVIKKQLDATNGQTVVALINNEATIKKYYKRGKRIELVPANPDFRPILVDTSKEETQFKIEGVLVGVIRLIK